MFASHSQRRDGTRGSEKLSILPEAIQIALAQSSPPCWAYFTSFEHGVSKTHPPPRLQ